MHKASFTTAQASYSLVMEIEPFRPRFHGPKLPTPTTTVAAIRMQVKKMSTSMFRSGLRNTAPAPASGCSHKPQGHGMLAGAETAVNTSRLARGGNRKAIYSQACRLLSEPPPGSEAGTPKSVSAKLAWHPLQADNEQICQGAPPRVPSRA